jgi:5-methyltetrahydropteroyltriglutamate--homocysteine methyltransferase
VEAFAPGIYPRSEELVQATRDLDRGRTTQEAVDEQVERDLQHFVAAQQDAGLDLLSDGMLRWQDVFRPLVDSAEGLERGALTRFLDTNTFYRAPHSEGEAPRLNAPLDESYIAPLPADRLVTLPAPFALSHGTGFTAREVSEGILRPQIEALDAELVVLNEPFLARVDERHLEGLQEALSVLVGGPRLALWITFGDAATLVSEGLFDLGVDAIGIDFYSTSIDVVPEGTSKQLLAGVLDARNSLLEDAREIASFAAQLEQKVERVALVPNGDLQYVSEPIAREKIGRLGQAKTTRAEEAA